MSITIESNTQSEQEMRDALEANGLTVSTPKVTEEPVKKAEEPKSSEPAGEPGEKIPAETEGKIATTTEVVEPKSQEPPQVEGEDEPPEPKPKAKGGFQAKVDKLTRRAEQLTEELESERGGKVKLQEQLDTVLAELEALKPAEAKQDEGPVKPKRPKMADVEFDQEKYDMLLEKYDEELDVYYRTVAKKEADATIATYESTATARARDAYYRGRLLKGAEVSISDIPDYDETFKNLPENSVTVIDRSPVIAGYLYNKSKNPAVLTHFLAKDYEEGGGENDRLAGLDEYEQLIEVVELEKRLVSEIVAAKKAPRKPAEPKPKAEPEPVAATPKPEMVPPVKEKPKAEALEPPIETVGTRAGALPTSMEKLAELAAAGDREAEKAFFAELNKSQAARRGRRA